MTKRIDLDKNKLYNLYYNEGKSSSEIAAFFGVSTAKDNPWKNCASSINRRACVNFVCGADLKNILEKYNGKCYYCDIELDYRQGYNGLHFDHVINGLQEVSNLVPTCPRCNTAKGDLTLEELENFVKKIKEQIYNKEMEK